MIVFAFRIDRTIYVEPWTAIARLLAVCPRACLKLVVNLDIELIGGITSLKKKSFIAFIFVRDQAELF